jgi:cupin fold WbuC family metalloprotein
MRTVTAATLDQLSSDAAAASRRRLNHNLHQSLEDPVQRLFNAFEPGTYARPHRHTAPPRWEVFVALRGRVRVLLFDDRGRLTERAELTASGPAVAVEIEAGAWHTLVSLAAGSLLFELKPGPYRPISDRDLAPWAPAEGDPGAPELVRWFAVANVGDMPPATR